MAVRYPSLLWPFYHKFADIGYIPILQNILLYDIQHSLHLLVLLNIEHKNVKKITEIKI